LGRSRGGFTTKLHAIVSETGQLARYVVTAGQVHDITQAHALVVGLRGRAVVGDRAYDCDRFIWHAERSGMTAVIPARTGRKLMRPLAAKTYRERNVIERWFGRLKQFRRVATRYEKTASSYSSSVAIAALCVQLSGWRA
jgi:transposase